MTFLEALKKQVIVLDGAMGTMIQGLNLGAIDFGGEDFQMLSDILSFSRPDELMEIHLAYFRAGANAVETNTFGASPLRLKEYDFSNLDTGAFRGLPHGLDPAGMDRETIAHEMNRVSAKIARRALEQYKDSPEYDGRPLFVVGSMGPSNHVLSPTEADLARGTWEMVEENFRVQAGGLMDGGVDVLLFETQQDVLELKAAVSGAFAAMEERGRKLPVMAQVTVDQFLRMQLFNTDIHAALTTLQGIGIDVFGINCSLGPELMEPAVEKLARFSKLPISVLPNAGMPVSENGRTVYKLGPDALAEALAGFVEKSGVRIVGGCCGTSPDHIRAVAQRLKDVSIVAPAPEPGEYLSGPQEVVPVDGQKELIRIGERLNARGSKKVREAVEETKGGIAMDILEEVVREQVKDLGTPLIDICMDSAVVDTGKVMPEVISGVTGDFPGALCLDSFDVSVLADAVKYYPGRPLINSISLETVSPGKTRLDLVMSAVEFHDPLYIALLADDSGPALSTGGKVALAKRIVEDAAGYGAAPGRLLMDINAFPIGSETAPGDNYAVSSLDAIPLIREIHPDLKTTIGVSNLTSGLAKKPYMRLLLTSVFLDEARKRGLTAAIVNPGHYVPVSSLAKEDYRLARKVIFEGDMDAYAELEAIAAEKQGKKVKKAGAYDHLSPAEGICERIKDGFKERCLDTVSVEGREYEYRDKVVQSTIKALDTVPPLALINDYLMKAMEELGALFSAGEVSLPHLLKSADVMQQVMGYIEFTMADQEAGEALKSKGTVVLGTIHQDVHSIGKDLTKTLFENYGYRVKDLGVQVSLEAFLSAALEEDADAIGGSALLVQTANHMLTLAEMMRERGIGIPLLIGGAPVNLRHASAVAMAGARGPEEIKENLFYCASAMDGVNIMEGLLSERKDALIAENRERLLKAGALSGTRELRRRADLAVLPVRSVDLSRYRSPQLAGGVEEAVIPLGEIPIDLPSLYGVNWKMGAKGTGGFSEEERKALGTEWLLRSEENGWVAPVGYTGVFYCNSDGDDLIVYDSEEGEEEIARFSFQPFVGGEKEDLISVARYFLPVGSGERDRVGLQLSTAGTGYIGGVEGFKEEKDLESAHLLQGLADRTAEDLAGLLHERLVERAGLPRGTGARFSPGYPGLSVAHNDLIHRLLGAERSGVELTEGSEFFPTSTTAALVCFHPLCAYA